MSSKKINFVIQTAFLGDLILSAPFLSYLKKSDPNLEIWLMCRKGTGEFFKKLNLVDRVFEVEKGNSTSYQQVLNEVNKIDVDKVWCLHQSFRSIWFALRIKAKSRLGFRSFWTRAFLFKTVRRKALLPDALRQLSLLCADPTLLRQMQEFPLQIQLSQYEASQVAIRKDRSGKLSEAPEWARVNLRKQVLGDTSAYKNLQKKLSQEDLFLKETVLIFPGSVWATKKWTETGFIELGLKLSKKYAVIVMGGPGEEELCQRVCQKIPDAISLAGQTSIYESLMVIARAKLVVANDSASSHLACLVDTAVVTCFGPTVLNFGYRPWGRNVYVAELEALQCRPCGKHGHKVCPRKTHECMVNLAPSEVIQMAEVAIAESI